MQSNNKIWKLSLLFFCKENFAKLLTSKLGRFILMPIKLVNRGEK